MKTPAKSSTSARSGKTTQAPGGKGDAPRFSHARAPEPAKSAVLAIEKPVTSTEQSKYYEKAIQHFHATDFAKAKALFEKAGEGPVREVAHAARLHARMCEQRLARPAPALRTLEDYYNYSIALMNRGELDSAEEHLRRALAQDPAADHIYYALALCRGLKGDFEGASAHLKRAIELQPRNRMIARNDPDFAEISHHPALRELLF
jgi:tetratricopeptide (TPR) repeat protein